LIAYVHSSAPAWSPRQHQRDDGDQSPYAAEAEQGHPREPCARRQARDLKLQGRKIVLDRVEIAAGDVNLQR
jgi:hypothetical protein